MLKALYLYLTWKCNLYCEHCWASAGSNGKESELSMRRYKEIIIEAKTLGASFLKISGGEPFLCEELTKQIITFADALQFDIQVETNCTFMTQETADFLKMHHCQVATSLDGMKEHHDARRNCKGAFEQTVQGIKLLIDAGVKVNVVYSLSKRDDSELQSLIELLACLNVTEMKINPIMKVGRSKAVYKEQGGKVFLLSASELLEIRNKFCTKPIHGVRVKMMLPVCMEGFSYIFDKSYIHLSCECHDVVGIMPSGDVCLCGIVKDMDVFVYGNVKDRSLNDILKNSDNYCALEAIEEKLEGLCQECAVKSLCKGSCRAVAYSATGSIYAPNPLCLEMDLAGKFPLRKKRKVGGQSEVREN